MAGSFGRDGGSVGQWVLITNHMFFNLHGPICRYVYDLSCGRWVVGNKSLTSLRVELGPGPLQALLLFHLQMESIVEM